MVRHGVHVVCFVLFSEIHLGVLLEKSENGADYMPDIYGAVRLY
jgi:hypothetical protein